MSRIEPWQLAQKQSLPLDCKIELALMRIRQFYEHYNGQVYVAFSGGKDSTVVLDLVRSLYPDVPALFADTGLEFPEIREFVKSTPNVTWLKPKKTFRSVLQEDGVPVVSKRVARYIWDLRRPRGNEATKNLRLTGMNRAGRHCPSMMIPKKWMRLLKAPFLISDKCCSIMKKEPFHRYQKQTGRWPINGTMAADSMGRRGAYLKTGCNSFCSKEPQSKPISVWVEDDVWEYIRSNRIPYSSIYDMGYARTGCVFCAFGCHLEKSPNRFQRMKETHPKLWSYCMDKLGMREVLEYVGVPCE